MCLRTCCWLYLNACGFLFGIGSFQLIFLNGSLSEAHINSLFFNGSTN